MKLSSAVKLYFNVSCADTLLDSFKVQFSHQIFSVFNQISFLVTQRADFGDFLHSKQCN